jgi:hypothetical protein
MYRLMVRSVSENVVYGGAWVRKFVWSTWSKFDSLVEAQDVQERIRLGRGHSTVIYDHEYERFCAAHLVH